MQKATKNCAGQLMYHIFYLLKKNMTVILKKPTTFLTTSVILDARNIRSECWI